MLRVVLVGWSEVDWRIYRQPQWMAEVRRDPSASGHPRLHFDIEEAAFLKVVEDWENDDAGKSRAAALARLEREGAIAVVRG